MGPMEVRPIRPEDEALYATFIARLTPEDLRVRFFTARPDLSHRFIARMTQIDYAREMAFVAIDHASGQLLGVSRLAADPDYAQAEYAVIVASDLKGRGLGWLLMQRLIDYARAEGIARLTGDVLAANATMLRMCQELGFAITPADDDPGLKRVVLDLATA
jgi:acetyltransferase